MESSRQLGNTELQAQETASLAKLRSWKGDRPMQIEWEMEDPMPRWLYREAAVLPR
jgi:hypothetical protein